MLTHSINLHIIFVALLAYLDKKIEYHVKTNTSHKGYKLGITEFYKIARIQKGAKLCSLYTVRRQGSTLYFIIGRKGTKT